MIELLLIVSGVYFIFIITVILSWCSISESTVFTKNLRKVSVIIPMRNEADNIEKIIEDIKCQSYSEKYLQVIIVDDHSTDQCVALVQNAIANSRISMQLIQLEDYLEGKKNALTKGIGVANGEVILTTDADCRVGPHWITSMIQYFESNTKMVFGPVRLVSTSFFGKIQMIDFAALIGLGAATWRLGMAGMCNGANLAFEKQVFAECGGYQGSELYPSGDDEFLLRKIKRLYPEGIKFAKNKATMVTTQPLETIRSFINQRIRWAGKWKTHKDIMTKLVAIFIFLFYPILIVATVVSVVNLEHIGAVLSVWSIKWVLDMVLVSNVFRLSEISVPWLESVVLSFLYPFYAIGIGFSTINYNFEWKGRQY